MSRSSRRAMMAGGASPASCTITLTTEFMSSFGLQEAQIDGQRVFIDNAGSDGVYGATTDLNSPRSMPSSGTIWVEMQNLQHPSTGIPFLSFISPDGVDQFQLGRNQEGNWFWRLFQNNVPQDTAIVSGADGDSVGIGLSANGDLRAIRNGSEVSLPSAFDAFWTADVALYAGYQSVSAGASGSLLVATCAENYNNYFSGIAGDNQDWGGNAI